MSIKLNLILENSRLRVRNRELLDTNNLTYLTEPASAASGTLTVENISGGAVSGYIILGEIGSEKTEIVQVHAATAPAGTTITLAANTVFAHPSDSPVYFVSYNQIEFSRATSSGGVKAVLATVAVTPDQEFTGYADTNTTGYAYARAKNSTTTTYSDYSDEQVYSSLTFNSIGVIIDAVFNRANEETEAKITRKEVLTDYIWGFINKVSELRTKWKHEESDQDNSNTTSLGGETFSLPSDIKTSDQKSIQCLSIEGYEPLKYISITDWRKKIAGLARSTLDGAVLIGATEVDLMDASNFAEAGTGYISGDTFTWTGKTDNQLTGVSGILAHDDGSVVYQSDACGLPEYYTIQNETGRLFAAPDDDYDGIPLVIDYYKETTRPDSENDTLPVKFVEACKDYCSMRVAEKKEDWQAVDRFEKKSTAGIIQVIRNERIGDQKYLTSKE